MFKTIFTPKDIDDLIDDYDFVKFEYDNFIILKDLFDNEEIFGFRIVRENIFVCELSLTFEDDLYKESFKQFISDELKKKGLSYYACSDVRYMINALTSRTPVY
jgi:hypothetical protein